MDFNIQQVKDKFNKVINALEEKLRQAAVLSASPALVEDLEISYQGYKMRLKELAAMRSSGARSLIVEPWDKNILKDIMTAISSANLGVTPTLEQGYIRLNLPPITGEDKERIIKKIKVIKEQARVNLRHLREDFIRELDKAVKEKLISEDQKFKNKEALEKIVKEYNEKIDNFTQKKIEDVKNA